MSNFLILSNLHLGIELFGAIVFFIAAWLFFEAYLIKKDLFSLARTIGFVLLSVWQILHAVGGESSAFLFFSFAVYLTGLTLVCLSYVFEKLPPKPVLAVLALPMTNISANFNILPTIFLAALTLAIIKRYHSDIDRLIKWLAVGFALLAIASFASNFTAPDSFGSVWFLGHALKVAAFVSITLWIWRFLSLRAREEALVIFVANSLFIALLITTTFSAFFLKSLERETLSNLRASGKIFSFYIENLENKALLASQIAASNPNFVSAVNGRDTADLERMSKNQLDAANGQFLTIASKNGGVFFKSNFPISQDENILAQSIGGEALEGRAAATIDDTGPEGLAVRATSPVISQGKIIGAVLTGYPLDKNFVEKFKETTGLEVSLFSRKITVASSILPPGTEALIPRDEFLGSAKLLDQDVIGNFLAIKNREGKAVASAALTTTPGALLTNAQSTNRLTMLIIALITIGLIIPLYRFTIFLTQ